MLNLELIFSILLISATFSAIANAILRKFSKSWSFLIDLPDDVRKFHAQPTPLIGGFGIFFSMCASFFVLNTFSNSEMESLVYPIGFIQFMLGSFGCLLIFMLDDIFSISYDTIKEFLYYSSKLISSRSQARLISSLKSFFNYLINNMNKYLLQFDFDNTMDSSVFSHTVHWMGVI